MIRVGHCFVAGLALTVAYAGCDRGGQSGGGASAEIKTEDDKTLYALGLMLGRNIATFNLSPSEVEVVKRGLGDSVSGKKAAVELEQYGPKINELARARSSKRAQVEKEKAKGFLEQAAKEPGVEKTQSGLLYKTIKPGSGDSPKPTDFVKVHYHGTLIDGTVFDSSVKRGQPAEFPLNHVIPCWTEGVGKMKVGEKARLICPAEIAYGDRGSPPAVPGGATLIFEVELLEIKPAPAAPPGGPPGMPPGAPRPPGAPPPPGTPPPPGAPPTTKKK
jgi:FKBP-type peptidyl-prolyl cis-trans isomerase FkpA